MGFQPGNKLGGRKPGSTNRNSAAIKDAYQNLLENNLDNISTWLAKVAEKDPARATELIIKLSDFVVPKLARTEVTGHDGEDLFKNISFQFNTANGKESQGTQEESSEA